MKSKLIFGLAIFVWSLLVSVDAAQSKREWIYDLASSDSTAVQETIKWTTQADFLRGKNGRQFSFICPANGTASRRLWGSGYYTDDSSICTAGVHAGVITLRDGGMVTIEIRPGIEAYASSSRNGITSLSYDFWPGSFVVIRESYTGPDRGSIARLLDSVEQLATF